MLLVCLFLVVRGAKALRATSFVGDVVAWGVGCDVGAVSSAQREVLCRS